MQKLKQLNPTKILIIRLSAIGDVIHALPVAKAVRNAYPEAELTWIVESKAEDLIVNNSYLDHVIQLPKAEWKESFKSNKLGTLRRAKEFFDQLKEQQFDLAWDLHGLFKSGLTAYLSGAKLRVGPSDARECSGLFYHEQVELPDRQLHQIERNLLLAQGIGAESDELDYGIRVEPSVKQRVDSLVSDLELDNRPLVVINPLTSWTAKNWLLERYAKLADQLINELNVEVIFTGGPSDREDVASILDSMSAQPLNLAGETNLQELAELYSRAEIFIGGDTGPMHLAAAMDTTVVTLMGPTTPQTHGPYGKQHTVIQADLSCLECWERACPRDNECMKQISVEEIYQAAKEAVECSTDETRD
ncbi:MAG: glycosyltransferase family 9 protein [Bacillota bacterium]